MTPADRAITHPRPGRASADGAPVDPGLDHASAKSTPRGPRPDGVAADRGPIGAAAGPRPDSVSRGRDGGAGTDGRIPYDVVAMGRLGVDLYPLRSGVGLADVDTFGRHLGGSAANVSVAAARHGRRVALVSRTGDDPFGVYLRRELDRYGVDRRWVTPVPGTRTPVTFCEIFPPDDFPIWFYRPADTPDLLIRPEELDLAAVRDARMLWLTGTGLSAQPTAAAHLAALRARGRRAETVLDLDYRPTLWSSAEAAGAAYRQALEHCTVAVGNLDECETAVGQRGPDAAAEALLALGVRLAMVKRGPEGVLARTAAGERVEVAPTPVDVVNGLGAGDAFGGALCHGLLAGWPLERVVRFASAAGALVAGELFCAPAMPTTERVEALLSDPAAPDA